MEDVDDEHYLFHVVQDQHPVRVDVQSMHDGLHELLLPLLWPVLYAAHAALVVVRVFPSSGRWPHAHMLIATVGYGLFTALVGHVVNRVALRRLRRLAHVEEQVGGSVGADRE